MLVRGYWEAPDMVIESGAGRPEQHDRKLQKQCMRMVLISHSRYTGRGPPPPPSLCFHPFPFPSYMVNLLLRVMCTGQSRLLFTIQHSRQKVPAFPGDPQQSIPRPGSAVPCGRFSWAGSGRR